MRGLFGLVLVSWCAFAFGDKPSAVGCRRALVQPFLPPLTAPRLSSLRTEVRAGALPDPLFQSAWERGSARTRTEVAQLLEGEIARGAYLDKRDRHGRTALMHAALSGNELLVDELWRRGARVDVLDDRGRSASDFALLARENADLVPDLVLFEKHLNVNGHVAPDLMAEFRRREFPKLDKILKQSLSRGYLASQLGEALLYYIEVGDYEGMRYVLDQGADPRGSFRHAGGEVNPLLLAAKRCDRQAVELLLERGLKINGRGPFAHNLNPVRQAIWMYASASHDDLPVLPFLKWLLSVGAQPDAHLRQLASAEPLSQYIDRLYPSGPRRRRVRWVMRSFL